MTQFSSHPFPSILCSAALAAVQKRADLALCLKVAIVDVYLIMSRSCFVSVYMSSTQIFIKYYLRAEDVRTEMKYKPSFLISA